MKHKHVVRLVHLQVAHYDWLSSHSPVHRQFCWINTWETKGERRAWYTVDSNGKGKTREKRETLPLWGRKTITIFAYAQPFFFLSRPSDTWSDNKVRELIAVKVLHKSWLNTTVVAFKVLPLRSYKPMPAPSTPFKTILELVLWNGLQSFLCITPDIINVIKMLSFQYFLYIREPKKSHWGLDPLNRQGVPTQLSV